MDEDWGGRGMGFVWRKRGAGLEEWIWGEVAMCLDFWFRSSVRGWYSGCLVLNLVDFDPKFGS